MIGHLGKFRMFKFRMTNLYVHLRMLSACIAHTAIAHLMLNKPCDN